MRLRTAFLAVLLMLAMVVSACAPAPEPAAPAPAAEEAAATEAPAEAAAEEAAATEAPAEEAAAEEAAAPAEGGVIKIASQTPLSGPQSVLGTAIRNGAQLALQQNGAALQELGFTVDLAPG